MTVIGEDTRQAVRGGGDADFVLWTLGSSGVGAQILRTQ